MNGQPNAAPGKDMTRAKRRDTARRTWRTLRLIFFGVIFVASLMAVLLAPFYTLRTPHNFEVGDITPEDIRAPREISYVSRIETERAREDARISVPDQYDPPDPRIGRAQVRRARQIMDFVQNVRADAFADTPLRQRYLGQLIDLKLSDDEMSRLLGIGDAEFELVERELVLLIEEAMSGPVREGRVQEVTGRLDLAVSAEYPEALIPVTVSMARQLIVANSALNEKQTEDARDQAEAAVPPIRYAYGPGETVIRAGDRINELDLEALEEMGLAADRLTWNDIASAFMVSLLAAVTLAIYLGALNPPWLDQSRHLFVMMGLFLVFMVAAQIIVPGTALLAYVYPAAALSLAVTALIGLEFAIVLTMVLAGLVGYISGGSLEMASFSALSGLLAAASLRRDARLNSFFLAGISAAVAGTGVLMAFRLPAQLQSSRLALLLVMALLNGLLSAGLALVLLFVAGSLTGIPTSLQLIDLMRPDHPLQRLMQREALGSYQHTLSVANLVEAAAEAIGADTLLARIGTLYHDVGKTTNPGFFIENRTEGQPNPLEGLSPVASARIIKAHVGDGIRLARKYRLPPPIVAFIPEHHGTTPIAFFLNLARSEAAARGIELDEKEFYYDGPLPQSRESAILMLADGCESAVRANRPATREEIEAIVSRIIQQRIDQNQLDESGLTLTDIRTIRDTFVRTLQGMYHPRVQYPGDEKPQLPASPPPELPAGGDLDSDENTVINWTGIDQ